MKPSTAVSVIGAATSGVSVYVGINALRGAKVPTWFLWLTVIGGGLGVLSSLTLLVTE